MPMRSPFGDSRRSSRIALAVGIGGLSAFTLLMDYLPEGTATPSAEGTAKLDACQAWKSGGSQSIAVLVRTLEDQPSLVENCLRAADRSRALRERRKANITAMGD